MTPRETENNAYGKFWGDKKRALWYVMVFSGMVNQEGLFQFGTAQPFFTPSRISTVERLTTAVIQTPNVLCTGPN